MAIAVAIKGKHTDINAQIPDIESIIPFPVESINTVAGVDLVLEKIRIYEAHRNYEGTQVGVVLRQNAACAGSYLVRTREEVPLGKQLGPREWYVAFWGKDYFLDLRQRLLQEH